MSNSFSFSLTPQIYPETIKRSGFKVTRPSAKYVHDSETVDLLVTEDGSTVLEDSTGKWTVEEYGVDLRYHVTIKSPWIIYDESGLTDSTIIYLVARLMSDSSRQRFVFKRNAKQIANSGDPIDFDFEVRIPSGKIHGDAKLEFIFYVSYSEDVEGPMPGSVLGVAYSQLFSFSGDGSEFPIETVSSDEKFLWRISMDYDDPRTDMFDQSVMLILNEKHPKFKDLKLDTNPMDSLAFREIMAQSFLLIISDVRRDPVSFDDIVNNTNLEPGSLGEAVYYMILNFASDYDDPILLSKQIHEMIDKRTEDVQ